MIKSNSIASWDEYEPLSTQTTPYTPTYTPRPTDPGNPDVSAKNHRDPVDPGVFN